MTVSVLKRFQVFPLLTCRLTGCWLNQSAWSAVTAAQSVAVIREVCVSAPLKPRWENAAFKKVVGSLCCSRCTSFCLVSGGFCSLHDWSVTRCPWLQDHTCETWHRNDVVRVVCAKTWNCLLVLRLSTDDTAPNTEQLVCMYSDRTTGCYCAHSIQTDEWWDWWQREIVEECLLSLAEARSSTINHQPSTIGDFSRYWWLVHTGILKKNDLHPDECFSTVSEIIFIHINTPAFMWIFFDHFHTLGMCMLVVNRKQIVHSVGNTMNEAGWRWSSWSAKHCKTAVLSLFSIIVLFKSLCLFGNTSNINIHSANKPSQKSKFLPQDVSATFSCARKTKKHRKILF